MLEGQRRALAHERDLAAEKLARVREYLAMEPKVAEALNLLSDQLFKKLTQSLERTLTYALQEVLGQSIVLKVTQDFKRGGVTIGFHIERDGQPEDIMKGQGGSVANILSVGLRMFALSQLDEQTHRRFLVLDEQDCWLAPDLVPRLVKVIHEAAGQLGFQTLMISHHDTRSFDQFADRIYELMPTADGVAAKLLQDRAKTASSPDPAIV